MIATAIASALDHRDAGAPVAIDGDLILTLGDLNAARTAIRPLLHDSAPAGVELLIRDPFLLLAALFAAQASACDIRLLPLDQPPAKLGAALRLSDFDVPGGAVRLPARKALLQDGQRSRAGPFAWDRPITFLTSGSTGTPKSVLRSPVEIAAEILALETVFGATITSDACFCSTVNRQHLFGFSFALMWPLLSGRLFDCRQLGRPGQIETAAARRPSVLVTSPAFVTRAEPRLDLPALGRHGLQTFCAGSPLSDEVAGRFNAHPGVRLVEIYGSTETGAIAHRTTAASATSWRLFPGAAYRLRAGVLQVRAPHIQTGDWCDTGDRAHASGAGFVLAGRADRVVKVADKRVSLTGIEHILSGDLALAEIRTLQLHADVLGAVGVPTELGWQQLRRSGKHALTARLRNLLATHLDRSTTPKRWRFVTRMPRGPLDKIVDADLQRLFNAHDRPPDWTVVAAAADHWEGELQLRMDQPEFSGHFPGEPVLPGVTQLSWAAAAARAAFNCPRPAAWRQIKFRAVIKPDQRLRLRLTYAPDESSVAFCFAGDAGVFSSGTMGLA